MSASSVVANREVYFNAKKLKSVWCARFFHGTRSRREVRPGCSLCLGHFSAPHVDTCDSVLFASMQVPVQRVAQSGPHKKRVQRADGNISQNSHGYFCPKRVNRSVLTPRSSHKVDQLGSSTGTFSSRSRLLRLSPIVLGQGHMFVHLHAASWRGRAPERERLPSFLLPTNVQPTRVPTPERHRIENFGTAGSCLQALSKIKTEQEETLPPVRTLLDSPSSRRLDPLSSPQTQRSPAKSSKTRWQHGNLLRDRAQGRFAAGFKTKR